MQKRARIEPETSRSISMNGSTIIRAHQPQPVDRYIFVESTLLLDPLSDFIKNKF